MAKFTNGQIDIMRDDLDSGFGYTKIRMIVEFVKKCKSEDPDISREDIWEKIKEFRKEKGWDETDKEESR